jgi:hypothetical protein
LKEKRSVIGTKKTSTVLGRHSQNMEKENSKTLSLKKKIETTVSASRVDGKLTCLKYSSTFNSFTTLNHHLGRMHDGHCSTFTKKKKKEKKC